MYAPQINNLHLNRIKPSYILKGKEHIINLQRYDKDYCWQMEDYLNNLIEYDIYKESVSGKEVKIIFKNPACEKEYYSIPITEFRINEEAVCTLDCNYFMDRYYMISNYKNQFIKFSPNKLQLINRNIRARLELARRAIKKLTLKARQTGETTDGLGVILHRLNFIEDVKSIIASYKNTETIKLARMFNDGFERIPYYLKKQYNEMAATSHYKYSNNSILTLGWGTEKALGRGATLLLFHLTEIAKYLYPEESVESALAKASHESTLNLGTIEGTAEKLGDWFDTFWHLQNKMQNEGLADFYCSFIPYVCRGDDLYPTKDWLHARIKAFNKWKPKQETIRHKYKVEQYIRTHSDLSDVMGKNWEMRKETMFYYEVEKEKYKARNKLHLFYREMPSDPDEAFQNAEQAVYPIEITTKLNDIAQQSIPSLYKIRGDSNEIDSNCQVGVEDDINTNKPSINIKTPYHWNFQTSFELIPLVFKGWDKLDYKNIFIIWDSGNENFDYTLGGDFSSGLGEGRSDDFVMEILRKGTISNKDKQVLEFASPDIPTSRAWPFILAGLLLYSFFGRDKSKQCLASLEAEKGGGQEAIDKLLMLGYSSIFELIDITKTGENKRFGRLGWFTNRRTRPIMVNHFNSFAKGDYIEILSPLLVSELKNLTKHETISSIYGNQNEKIAGKVDNRWIATCIALYSSHQNEMLGFEKAAWENRQSQDSDLITLANYDYGSELSNLSQNNKLTKSLWEEVNPNSDYDDLVF